MESIGFEKRRWAMVLLSGLAMCCLVAPGWATDSASYPSRPVTAVVGSPPGQSSDSLMRVVATHLSKRLGQSVITENRPGAGASLGPAHVAKSMPDGYTLLLGTSGPLTIRPNIFGTDAYDPVKSFVPVAPLAYAPMVLAVASDSDIHSLADLVKLAKSRPGEVTYGSPGVGSINHLVVELLAVAAQAKFQHIPYKGSPQVFTDVIGGRVHLVADPIPGIIGQIKSGSLRALAVTDTTRSPLLPEVPTVIEAGFPDMHSLIWFGLLAPKDTPVAILDRLESELTQIMASEEMSRWLSGMGLLPMTERRADFGEQIRRDTVKWKQLIDEIGGITP